MRASSRTWYRGRAELSGEDGRGQRLAGARRSDQQELASGRETVLRDPSGVALFTNDASNLGGERFFQNHLHQTGFRVGSFEQVRELAPRASDRNRRARDPPALRLVDHGSQLFGELAVPQPRLVCRDLHGDGEEAVVVAVEVRPEERLDVLSAGHGAFSGNARRESHPEDLHDLVAEVVDDLDRDSA